MQTITKLFLVSTLAICNQTNSIQNNTIFTSPFYTTKKSYFALAALTTIVFIMWRYFKRPTSKSSTHIENLQMACRAQLALRKQFISQMGAGIHCITHAKYDDTKDKNPMFPFFIYKRYKKYRILFRCVRTTVHEFDGEHTYIHPDNLANIMATQSTTDSTPLTNYLQKSVMIQDKKNNYVIAYLSKQEADLVHKEYILAPSGQNTGCYNGQLDIFLQDSKSPFATFLKNILELDTGLITYLEAYEPNNKTLAFTSH